MKKITVVCYLTLLLWGCGGNGGSWSGSNANEGGDTTGSAPSQPVCCKVCSEGKACGDSCIDKDKECHQPPGCACDAASATSSGLASIETVSTSASLIPRVGVGKLDLISGVKYQSGHEEGRVDEQGTYTYEIDKSVSFSVGTIKVAEVGPEVNRQRLNLNTFNANPKATLNAARLLITLDKDADPYQQGIVIPPDVNAQADGIQLDLTTAINLDNNTEIRELISATTNTSTLAPVEYAKIYLEYLRSERVKPVIQDH